MHTYNPKQLGEPEVIREINPTVLCAFLKPFEGYLRTRGLEVREPRRIDSAAIEKLVDIRDSHQIDRSLRRFNFVNRNRRVQRRWSGYVISISSK